MNNRQDEKDFMYNQSPQNMYFCLSFSKTCLETKKLNGIRKKEPTLNASLRP